MYFSYFSMTREPWIKRVYLIYGWIKHFYAAGHRAGDKWLWVFGKDWILWNYLHGCHTGGQWLLCLLTNVDNYLKPCWYNPEEPMCCNRSPPHRCKALGSEIDGRSLHKESWAWENKQKAQKPTKHQFI